MSTVEESVPLAPGKIINQVQKRLREIEKKSKTEIYHLSEFLRVSYETGYTGWVQALEERDRYYKNTPLPESDAAVGLGQLLKSQFESRDSWRGLLNGLAKSSIESSVKTNARTYRHRPVSIEVFDFLVQQAEANGSPDAEELISWLFDRHGVTVAVDREQENRERDERRVIELRKKRAKLEEELKQKRVQKQRIEAAETAEREQARFEQQQREAKQLTRLRELEEQRLRNSAEIFPGKWRMSGVTELESLMRMMGVSAETLLDLYSDGSVGGSTNINMMGFQIPVQYSGGWAYDYRTKNLTLNVYFNAGGLGTGMSIPQYQNLSVAVVGGSNGNFMIRDMQGNVGKFVMVERF